VSDSGRLLLHAFSTFNMGGAQSRFVRLANAFGPRYRHVIVSMDGGWEAAGRLAANVSWQRLELDTRRTRGVANRAAFRGALLSLRPNLLLSYNWGAIEWAAANLPRCGPQVHVEDGFNADEAHAQFARRVWARRLLLGVTGIPLLVPSARLQRLAPTWWIRSTRLIFIPNGVAVCPEQVLMSPRTNDALPIVIGTVAALRPEKNLARLLRAFASLRRRRELRLVIVGDGGERARLEALARQLGIELDVEFTGYLAEPELALRRFDLFALSSDTEQLPISMLEAMSQGIPVVATRVGDVAELMPPEARQAIADPDDQRFEQTLDSVLDARAQWPTWVAAGRERVRQCYSFDAMVSRWQDVFDGRLAASAQRAVTA
jgi:glycosyltransferase involved in cell wall biosynthesis